MTFAPRASTSSRAGRSSPSSGACSPSRRSSLLDIAGLALGIYLALVVRELVTGNGDVLWSLLWREGPAEWLKFAAPITVLVFAQAGLYRRRELRPGAGRILACLIVVALIVLAFGIGTGYDFSTSGLIPTSVILSAVTIGLLRAAYESAALEVMRAAGIRRRVVLVGRGREPRTLARLPRIGPERAVVRVRGRRRARTPSPASGCWVGTRSSRSSSTGFGRTR